MGLTAAESHRDQQVPLRDEALAVHAGHLGVGGEAVDLDGVARANGHRGRDRQAGAAGGDVDATAGKPQAGLVVSKLHPRDHPSAGMGPPLDRCLCHLEHPPSVS